MVNLMKYKDTDRTIKFIEQFGPKAKITDYDENLMILFHIVNFHPREHDLFYGILEHIKQFNRRRKWFDLFK